MLQSGYQAIMNHRRQQQLFLKTLLQIPNQRPQK